MEKQLTADLNVVANSNLEIQLLDGDLNIIQKLDDEPNDVGGLTSAELKAKFDESGNIIKKYINETLIPAVLTDDATEESRKQAEAARVAAEQGRVTAEEGRVSAEAARAAAEQARSEAESSRVSAENAREAAETARADETVGIVAQATAQANAAAGSASQAAGSEQSAKDAAGTATGAAISASQSAAAASGSASQASAAATAAAQSAASVDGINKTAQSWAVGGTGTRPGEDTDNAKYWAEKAQAVVGGDFATKVEAQGYVTTHNQSADAHTDIRDALAGKEAAGAAATVQNNLAAHAINTTVHVTAEQKTTWDNKAAGKHASQHGANGNDPLTPDAIGAVGYNAPQALTDAQKAQARTNIGCELDDPPMLEGIEYRTTERFLGKPVYAYIKKFGACAAGTMAYEAIGNVNPQHIISVYGIADDMALPHIYGVPGSADAMNYAINLVAQISITTNIALSIFCGAKRSISSAYVCVKYTKTTD